MLDWHEWTEESPPPNYEQLLFTFSLHDGDERIWFSGIGWYIPEEKYVWGKGARWLSLPRKGGRICWARFNLPGKPAKG